MAYEDLFKVGTELKDFQYNGFLDWLVKFSDPKVHWQNEPTYIIAQCVYLFGGLLTLLHAFIRGGRLPYLWLAIYLHGYVVESISYILPDVDNFWHSQTPIILFGGRLPLHITFLYPCFLYQASVAVAKLRLPNWAEPFAVGLCVVLIDIPYDIVCVRFLHWTWHDTDPNIFDRHYWVPWNSYYFHATFAASFTFCFHFSRRLLCQSEGKWIRGSSVRRELLCTIIAALLGTPGGIAMFIPIYHPLKDLYNIHSEVTFFILFAIFLLVSWVGDRSKKNEDSSVRKTHWSTWLLVIHLVAHYATFLAMVLFFNPEDEISTGLHETVGPCDQMTRVRTPMGMVLHKRKYLCIQNYDEEYFDFRCLPEGKAPSNGSKWYTACGVPFQNRVEYIVIVSLLCLVATVVFGSMHFFSYGDEVLNGKLHPVDKKSKKAKKQ